MGCQTTVVLGDNLTFTITTHDPDTGVLTDADAPPSYRVYEDETAAAILNGNMATLDAGNTTGFYSELIACTAGNGFEVGKSYNIYIEATVDGDTGGISYGFTIVPDIAAAIAALNDLSAAQVNAEVVDVISTDTYALPGQANPPNVPTFAQMVTYLYKNFRNQKDQNATTWQLYDDAGAVVDQKASVADAAGTLTFGEVVAGP